MRSFLVGFLCSLGISALLTPVVLRFARRLSLYDRPDGVRKIHQEQIPRIGGIAIAAGFCGPILGLLFFGNFFANQLAKEPTKLMAFLIGGLSILTLGLYDDLKGVGAWGKLTIQVAVGTMLWWCGMSFDQISILDYNIQFGIMSWPLTVLWLAGLVNAMNLIDGLDGLAAGVAFFAGFSLFTVALMDNELMLALFAACIAGSVLGFLLYNFNPALIFMGDSGSMTIGYIFAACSLWNASKRSTALSLLLPMLALGLPIFDTLFAFARRALTGRSPFHSDRGHVHHRLIDAGLSHRQTVLSLYLLCGLLTAATVLTRATLDPRYGVAILALMGALIPLGRVFWSRMAPPKAVKLGQAQAAAEEVQGVEQTAPASTSTSSA